MSRAPGYEVDWNLVRTFVSVVEEGSLAGAARSLKLAHPTVARHIQQLESQLGVSLFERCAGGLVLNEAGQRLADVAERMRRQAIQLESACELVRNETTGRVRVTIAEVFADLFPELLSALKSEPGWDDRYVELIVSPRRLNLLDREADIAVRHIRPDQNDLVCRRVGSLPLGAWASEGYLAEYGVPDMQTLHGHRFIDGLTTRGFVLALEGMGYPIPEGCVSFRTDSLQSQRRAAELGWGIAALPNYLAERTRGLVQVLGEPPESAGREIWLVGRPAVREQGLLRMVFDALARGLGTRFGHLQERPPQGADRGAGTSALTA